MPLCRPHARRIRPAMLCAAICLPFASLLPSAVHAEIPLRDLGSLGGPESMAHALSADGSVVVGRSDLNAPASHAFRWTAATGMVDLGVLPGANDSSAREVSANGQVVVGFSNPGSVFRAFRWTQAGGMINLGTLGGDYSMANAVSADGSVSSVEILRGVHPELDPPIQRALLEARFTPATRAGRKVPVIVIDQLHLRRPAD